MNLNNNQYKENIDNLLDNKLIIGAKENERKACNIILCIVTFFMLLIFIVLLLSKNIEAIIFFIMLGIILLIFNYCNEKIIIENSTVSKISMFKRKKKLGSMSDITSISNDNYYVTVLKNNQKFFSFNIHGMDDNIRLYNYLKSKYCHSIRIIGIQSGGIISCTFGVFGITLFLGYIYKGYIDLKALTLFIFGIFFIIYGINECIKKFQVIDDKIVYKKLLTNKIYNISDLTKIELKKSYYARNLCNVHEAVGYIGNKKVFKIEGVTPQNLKLLKEKVKKYNWNCKVKNNF